MALTVAATEWPQHTTRLTAGSVLHATLLPMRLVWLLGALVLCAALAALNIIAQEYYLFWRYEWFDVPMHYLGGLAIGVFLIGFLIRFRPLLFSLSFLAIAVGWEIFEFVFGLPKETNYVFDTALDLLMDTMGAVTAYGIARVTTWR